MRYRLAIFDFDGTLSDSLQKIAGVANCALQDFGLPVRSLDDVRSLVGLPLSQVMGKLGGGREVKALCVRYRELWNNKDPAPLFQGVIEMLAELQDAGVRLAIATNRKREGLETMLALHGVDNRFDFLVGGACTVNRKPHPEPVERVLAHVGVEPGETVVVGDTTFDMAMGSAAGADTCAVTYGAHTRAALVAEAPTHVADTVAEVYGLLCGSGAKG